MGAFIIGFGVIFTAVILIIFILLKHSYDRIESLEHEMNLLRNRINGDII